jgi:antitoxin (DNA-binding transcriptional repressor) of toxin-antitoxin stability system
MTAAHAHELPPESGELVLTSEEVAAVERDGKIVILTRDGRPVAKVHAIDPIRHGSGHQSGRPRNVRSTKKWLPVSRAEYSSPARNF